MRQTKTRQNKTYNTRQYIIIQDDTITYKARQDNMRQYNMIQNELIKKAREDKTRQYNINHIWQDKTI